MNNRKSPVVRMLAYFLLLLLLLLLCWKVCCCPRGKFEIDELQRTVVLPTALDVT